MQLAEGREEAAGVALLGGVNGALRGGLLVVGGAGVVALLLVVVLGAGLDPSVALGGAQVTDHGEESRGLLAVAFHEISAVSLTTAMK